MFSPPAGLNFRIKYCHKVTSLCATGNHSTPIFSWHRKSIVSYLSMIFFFSPRLVFLTLESIHKLMLSIYLQGKKYVEWKVTRSALAVGCAPACLNLLISERYFSQRYQQNDWALPKRSKISSWVMNQLEMWKLYGLLPSLPLGKQIQELLRDCWIPEAVTIPKVSEMWSLYSGFYTKWKKPDHIEPVLSQERGSHLNVNKVLPEKEAANSIKNYWGRFQPKDVRCGSWEGKKKPS